METRLNAALAVVLIGCSSSPDPQASAPIKSDKERVTAPDVGAQEIAAVAHGNTAFAVDLYRAVSGEPGNIIFSPWSISIALGMTYAGARGDTAAQIRETLHFTLPDEDQHAGFNALDLALSSRGQGAAGSDGNPFRLNIANAIWGQAGYPFQPAFLDTLALNYGAGLQAVDYGDPETARATINDWVSDHTADKIPELLPAGIVTALTRLVLTNAVYFNAAWKDPFASDLTRDRPFHLLDGTTVAVPTMDSAEAEFAYVEAEGYRAVQLPYDGDELSMIVIVPDDLAAFEATLDADTLTGLEFPSRALLRLPRFDFSSAFGLKATLAGLGMVDAFDISRADLKGIADAGERLYISAVVHKGFITVNEKGTEAGAATGVVIGTDSAGPPLFEVDRPFLFVIRDEATGVVLFLGRVVDPRP